MASTDASFADSVQATVNIRMETLREVLIGQMNPLERRLEILSSRQSLISGISAAPLADNSPEDRTGGSVFEQKASRTEPADSVKIEAESPSEDGLRVANYLAEKHSDAETIALSSEDTIEVREAPGGTFMVDVNDVLQREFDEGSESSIQASSVPSMSTASAENPS